MLESLYSVGGGSVMDTAKVANLYVRSHVVVFYLYALC